MVFQLLPKCVHVCSGLPIVYSAAQRRRRTSCRTFGCGGRLQIEVSVQNPPAFLAINGCCPKVRPYLCSSSGSVTSRSLWLFHQILPCRASANHPAESRLYGQCRSALTSNSRKTGFPLTYSVDQPINRELTENPTFRAVRVMTNETPAAETLFDSGLENPAPRPGQEPTQAKGWREWATRLLLARPNRRADPRHYGGLPEATGQN